ncbi:putative phiE125 gp8 family phage protein [Bradyrhizobium sp. LM2.7]
MDADDDMDCVLALITAPTIAVVSRDDVKTMLGIATTGQDGMIDAAILSAVAVLDPAAGGWLGRALRPQQWELRLSAFPRCEIELPFPPLVQVDSFVYDDQGGTTHTMVAGTNYRVLRQGGLGKQALAPLYNQLWPVARKDRETVRVRYTAGYAATPNDLLPAKIKHAIGLSIRGLLTNSRDAFVVMDKVDGVGEKRYAVTPAAAKTISDAIDNLLSTARAW